LATNFIQGGLICPPAALDNMAPSRAGDVSHSPGRVADSLQWNWVSSCRAQIGRSLKFCVHAIWQVQDISDAWSIHSAVLCITSLLFPSGRKEAREREKKMKKQLSSG
jgi:hypothetical protein